jgi:hypothetical protein
MKNTSASVTLLQATIMDKLRSELTIDIASERQVVYILVQVRKLLELNADQQRFPALKFYCDWATHAEMEREGAKRIVRRLNEWQRLSEEAVKARDAGIERNPEKSFLAEMYELTGLGNFKAQLADFLNVRDIDAAIVTDSTKWATFIRYYCSTVSACPLKCRERGLQHVDEVILTLLNLEPSQMGDWTLVVRWTWISKTTGHESRTHAFF